MPEFTVKEVRLPELHLPEIKRDEIVRALSGVRLPEVDLARARRAKLKVPAVTLTADDVGKLLAASAAITRFVRPAPSRVRVPRNPFGRRSRSPVALIVRPRSNRSRRPIVLGAIVVALAIWAIVRRPEVRRRIEIALQDARERFATWRAEDLRPERDTADDGMTHIEAATTEAPELDLAAHAAETDGVPAFEESRTPG